MIDGENRPDQSLWLRTGEDISSRRRCRDCTFGASRSRTPGARGNPRVQGRSPRHAISVILPPVTCPPPGDPRGILSYGGRDCTYAVTDLRPTSKFSSVRRRSMPVPRDAIVSTPPMVVGALPPSDMYLRDSFSRIVGLRIFTRSSSRENTYNLH